MCKADCCHVRADCPDAPTRTACFYSRESCTLCTTTSDTSLICVTSLFSSRESSTPSTTQLAVESSKAGVFGRTRHTRVSMQADPALCAQRKHLALFRSRKLQQKGQCTTQNQNIYKVYIHTGPCGYARRTCGSPHAGDPRRADTRGSAQTTRALHAMSERHLCYYGRARDLLPLSSTDRARPLRATKALGEGWGRRPSESAPIYA